MFDVGWSELMVIGVVGLIVIGPKDLPDMFRTMGRFTAKARSMARDFQRAMEAAADESGVKDVAKDLKNVTSPRAMGLDAVKQAATKFEQWDPLKPAPKPVAAKPADEKRAAPLGPATQALADAQAAKRAAGAAPVATLQADPDAPPPRPKPAAIPKPAAATPGKATASKVEPAAPVAQQKAARTKVAVLPDAAKPVRKPRAKKTDAGKTDA